MNIYYVYAYLRSKDSDNAASANNTHRRQTNSSDT